MNKKYCLIILFIFLFGICSCSKADDEEYFKIENDNIYVSVGDVVTTGIEIKLADSALSISYLDSNIEDRCADVEIINNEIIVEGKKAGVERVKILLQNEDFSAELKVNVVGERIYVDDFFSKEQKPYLIYFYKENCFPCQETNSFIYKYLENENDENIEVYFCKFEPGTAENKLHRVYNLSDGEGNNNKSKASGAQKVDDIYISDVPAIVKVEEFEVSFIADGKTKVQKYIQSLK